MQQKTTWVHSMLIGIKICSLTALISCESDTEYVNTVEFQFSNLTDHKILFPQFSEPENGLELGPGQTTEVLGLKGGGPKSPDPQICCQDILNDLIGPSGKLYVLDDSLCLVHINEKSDLIENYQIKLFSERDFRYTYTFRPEDFEDAERCE